MGLLCQLYSRCKSEESSVGQKMGDRIRPTQLLRIPPQTVCLLKHCYSLSTPLPTSTKKSLALAKTQNRWHMNYASHLWQRVTVAWLLHCCKDSCTTRTLVPATQDSPRGWAVAHQKLYFLGYRVSLNIQWKKTVSFVLIHPSLSGNAGLYEEFPSAHFWLLIC